MVVLAGLGIWFAVAFWNEEPAPWVSASASGESGERRVDGTHAPASAPLERSAPHGGVDRPIEARPPVDDDQFPVLEADPGASRRAAPPSSLVIAIRNLVDEPLGGVRVTLRPGAHDRRTAVTGGDGEVAFADLAAGRYGYRVEMPGRPQLEGRRGARAGGGRDAATRAADFGPRS